MAAADAGDVESRKPGKPGRGCTQAAAAQDQGFSCRYDSRAFRPAAEFLSLDAGQVFDRCNERIAVKRRHHHSRRAFRNEFTHAVDQEVQIFLDIGGAYMLWCCIDATRVAGK